MDSLAPLALETEVPLRPSVSGMPTRFEQGFYGVHLLLAVEEFHSAIGYHSSVKALPPSAHKADHVWQAQKRLVASGGNFIASLAVCGSLLDKLNVISLGVLASVFGIVGYAGWGISSLFRLHDVIAQITQQFYLFEQATDSGERSQALLKGIERTVCLAYHVSMVALGVFGVLASCTASSSIVVLLHWSFAIVGALALIELGLIIAYTALTPPPETGLCSQIVSCVENGPSSL